MSNEKDLIHISIEAVGSGIPLLKLNVPSSIQSNELYERVMFDLNKVDDTIILFFDYDFNNPLKETEDSMKDLYGDVKRITFALMTKILTEREILEKIYYATNGPNWKRNDNWLSDKPLKEWYGIEVHEGSDEKFIIKVLSLSSNKLEGVLPKEIGKLTYLQELYLSSNKLEGVLPKEIGKLANLQKLFLSNNKLEGEIPKEIGKLTNLQELYLQNNKLEGEIPKEIQELKCYKKI